MVIKSFADPAPICDVYTLSGPVVERDRYEKLVHFSSNCDKISPIMQSLAYQMMPFRPFQGDDKCLPSIRPCGSS